MIKEPLPWVKYEKIEENAGRFIVSPLRRGMGTTLGNSMRRTILSSLSGIAVTAVRIDGIEHEFSTIPKVVEDVLDIICNIKGIVFRGEIIEPKILKLNFDGKGEVTAKHIKCIDGLEIINKNHHIADVTEKGKLHIELTVEKGKGYYSSEMNKRADQPINTINTDSSFSPIIRVNHRIENIRVGKALDYESLYLEVWTNGSATPEETAQRAAQEMVEHLKLFGALNQKPEVESSPEAEDLAKQKKESALNLNIDDLELSARSSNCLKRAGIETVGQLVSKDISELIQIKNFGKKSADEINDKLKQYNLCLKGIKEEYSEAEEKEEVEA